MAIVAIVAEAAGELVGGRYRLIEPVGQGGMGRVWRGRDEVLDREVAVKEILLPQGLVPEQRDLLIQRVMREARSAARLNHPGIITIHDVAEHNGAPLIVMEFISGRSLATVVREEGRLAPARVAAIGAAMLDALSEAHAAGIVHRDLKPDNVLITGRRTIITDFGIASMVDATALTSTGAKLGTPLYMAPEQIDGKPATPASDLWSLGATLYAAVEGQTPFTGPTLPALFNAIFSKAPRPAEHAGPLRPILAALLNKDPSQRATADQAAQSFAALLAPPTARPLQPDPRTLPLTGPARTHPGSRPSPPGPPATAPVLPSLTRTTDKSPAVRHLPRRTYLFAILGAAAVTVIPSGLIRLSESSKNRNNTIGHTGAAETATPKTPTPETPANEATLTGHTSGIMSVAFSPDGKTLATGSYDHTVRLWDVASRTSIATLTGHDDVVNSVAFSPDGKTLATGSVDMTVRLWKVASRTSIATLTGHDDAVNSVAFSPDGKILATGSWGSTVRLWDVASRTSIAFTSGTGRLSLVVFSPDGKTLAASSDDGTVRLWRVASRTNIATLDGGCPAFSPDGKTLATGSVDQTVQLWKVASRKSIATLTGHTDLVNSSVNSVVFSPDGKTLATGSDDMTVRLWDVASRTNIATLTGHTGPVGSVAFSPDGKTLASGSNDWTVRLWRIR